MQYTDIILCRQTLAPILSENQYENTACIFIDPHSTHRFTSFFSSTFSFLSLSTQTKWKKCSRMFSCLFGHRPSDPFMDFAIKCSYVFILVFFSSLFSVGPFRLLFLLCIYVIFNHQWWLYIWNRIVRFNLVVQLKFRIAYHVQPSIENSPKTSGTFHVKLFNHIFLSFFYGPKLENRMY